MTDPDPHLSRRDAERLLDEPAEHDSALGWALTAASAPGFPDELQREDATVAAFHAGRIGFTDIVDIVRDVVESHESPTGDLTVASLAEAEKTARRQADLRIAKR